MKMSKATYNFDEPLDRRLPDACKWAVADGELPMWVADMDFRTAPEVRDAIVARAEHGAFGYSEVTDEWRSAVADWWQSRHGLELQPSELVFSTGVVAALSSAVRALTNVHENVVVQPPVYNIFWNSVVNNGRHVLESPLVFNGERWQVDWADLEEKLADPQTSLMVVCNPHNPTGTIWQAEELARIGELCERHGVAVFSDEIHCELTRPGRGHVPFAAASDLCRKISVTAASPSKAFNLAGMQSAYIFASDAKLRHRVERQLNTDECAEPNAFAISSAVAAYTSGAAWLDALRDYIQQNKDEVARFVSERIDGVRMCPSDATYLCWLDCRSITLDDRALCDHLRAKTGLILSTGSQYGEAGKGFLRMNVGTRAELVRDGLSRLERGVDTFVEPRE